MYGVLLTIIVPFVGIFLIRTCMYPFLPVPALSSLLHVKAKCTSGLHENGVGVLTINLEYHGDYEYVHKKGKTRG